MIVSSKVMKTEGHTINFVYYYYYSLTLLSFNGSMMSGKKVYIFSRVKNQVIIGQLTAVAAIKNSWFRDAILSDVVTSEECNFSPVKH